MYIYCFTVSMYTYISMSDCSGFGHVCVSPIVCIFKCTNIFATFAAPCALLKPADGAMQSNVCNILRVFRSSLFVCFFISR